MNTTLLLELLSHTAMKGAAVLLVALLLGLILSRMAAARRYALWITAVTTLAMMPLAMWLLPAWHVLPQAAEEMDRAAVRPELVSASIEPALTEETGGVFLPSAEPFPIMPVQAAAPASFFSNISWQDVVEALPGAWIFIAGLLLLRLGRSAWCLHRLEAVLHPGECPMLEQAARELGLKRLPRLLIGPADAVPMVWGVWKPRLLLPEGFTAWSHEKQHAVLLHELAHLRRGDPLALWAAQGVKALHWFNPLVWLTLRQLRADQERACDDAVLRQGVRASDYAQSLLDLSRHNRLAPGLSLCALTITRSGPVEARVKAILDPTRRREGLTLRWLAGLACCALLFTLPVAMLHAIEGPPLRGRILDRNGVVLAETTKEKVRIYPLKALASNVIGFVRLTEDKVPQIESRGGIEKQQEGPLHEGKDVSLTLDARIQTIAGRAMTGTGHTRGAVVVLDPSNGAVLAMVSLPLYDPNQFAPKFNMQEWYVYDRGQDRPLYDRCVNLLYSPSGGYVPLTALAAISAGRADEVFDCKPARTSYTSKFECLKIREGGSGHGKVGMEAGMQHSCRHYWCELGMTVGLGEFGKVGQKIGFGQTFGVLEAESPGTLPTQEWWETRRRGNAAWSEDSMAALAEGFGYSRVNALQMAVLAAAVANTGRVPQPTLLHGAAPAWRADLVKDGLAEAQIQRLREGMRLAVNSDDGAGNAARSGKAVIAGSVGAVKAANPEDLKGPPRTWDEWFVGFAPFETPKLAFAILTQDGNNSQSSAAAVAKRLVEETLALPSDGSGQVPPLEDTVDRSVERTRFVKFGDQRSAIASAVSKAQKDCGAGLLIKSRTIEDDSVTIRGEASNLSQALQFKNKLAELSASWRMTWVFPVPRTLADSVRVEFRATGNARSGDETPGKELPVKPVEKKSADAKPTALRKTAAKVIDRNFSTSSNSLIIDKGSLDGIVADSAVTISAGLVGKTAMPEPHTTKVILLTDKLCRVSAKVEGTLNQGILNGESAADAVHPLLHLRFLSRYAKIKAGSSVYSSGEGGVFPADLLLGRVKQFKSGDISGEALVEPAVDFSTLENVFVMEMKAEPPGQEAAITPKPPSKVQIREQIDVAEISRQIRVLAKETGVEMSGFKAGHSVISIVAVSDGMDDALLFRDRLIELGKQWQVTWKLTTPQKVPDRAKVMFTAVGIYRTASLKIVTAAAIASSTKDWEVLQKFGKLANLPAGAEPDKLTYAESFTAPSMPTLRFAFIASREAVHEWLSASLPSNKLESQADKLRELGGSNPFRHDFWIHDNCWVRVECEIARARVLVYRQTLILIAPDESQEPRPAGKLAPDYKQEGVTSVKPLVPALDVTLQQLHSEAPISLPPVRMMATSLQHLAGGLGDESASEVRSSQSNRKRQALLVTLPLKN